MHDRESGRFRGCGYIEFADGDTATKAIALNGTDLLGRPMKIEATAARAPQAPDRPLSEKPEGCVTCFCGNLPFDISEEGTELKAFLEGTKISYIRWLTDRNTGEFKGAGYIEFEDEASVDKAVTYNGQFFGGRKIRLDYAKTREQRG